MKIKYNYLPFIVIFITCIVVISLVNSLSIAGSHTYEQIIRISDADKSSKDWFFERGQNNEKPRFPAYVVEYEKNYNIQVIGNKEKELYLTFDCGYEYNNYTIDILDILKQENIKGAFFVTGQYLRDNPEIINRMVTDGHIVGNHGNTHANLSKLKEDQIKKEVLDWEARFTSVTGLTYTKKYFRPASGIYTEQVLAIAQELGYTTTFWSLAYKDWETNNQPGRDAAYTHLIQHTHDGCILMLHTVSQSNREALRDVVIELKRDGYQFKSLDEFPE